MFSICCMPKFLHALSDLSDAETCFCNMPVLVALTGVLCLQPFRGGRVYITRFRSWSSTNERRKRMWQPAVAWGNAALVHLPSIEQGHALDERLPAMAHLR